MYKLKSKRVLVTGGASFIGSHLVDALLERGVKSVRIVDDLSSGSEENIAHLAAHPKVAFLEADLKEPRVARNAMKNIDIVFHLAADHGGRGYVDLHQAGPASNLFLDGIVFWEAVQSKVEKIVFASSGCVYPNHLQTNVDEILFLTEDLVKPPYDSDNLYGWAKLMAELTLKAYHQEFGIKTASCRFFTVYGPRCKENHAVIGLIAKAFIKQNPYQVWGDGMQIRNWTYISDIVEGMLRSAEEIDDGTAVNLGTMERIQVLAAAKQTMDLANHVAAIQTQPDMPTGPVNRVADNSLAKKLLTWEPKVMFEEGLKRTLDWYFATKNREEVRHIIENGGLIQRKVSAKSSPPLSAVDVKVMSRTTALVK